MAAEKVLGDWNEFNFELATPAHEEEIAQHVRDYFLRGETMNMYLGWDDNNAKNHNHMVKIALTHRCSFIVREKATGELAAVQLVMDKRLPGFETQLNVTSIVLSKILSFITQIEDNTEEVFRRDFKCDFYADIFISSVATKFRGRGLAREIYTRLIPFLRAKGFPCLRSTFTSSATRAIGAKFGFVEIGRLYFKDAVDEHGEKLFPMAGDGEEEFAAEIAYAL